MTYHTLLSKFHQSGQRLINHLLQATGQIALKLHIVHVDEIDVVDVEPLHTLKDACGDALSRIVPEILAVLAIASHFRREVVFITWYLLQRFT